MAGIMAEHAFEKRQRLRLTREERKELLFQDKVQRAAAMFVDFENWPTTEQIARELGISVMSLNDLTKTKEFNDVYNEYYIDMTNNPRMRAIMEAAQSLVGTSFSELKKMIADPETPPSVRLNAIKLSFEIGGLQAAKAVGSDRNEVANFLKSAGINIETLNVGVPSEFKDKIDAYNGEFREMKDVPPLPEKTS